jgi:hypothetical protein
MYDTLYSTLICALSARSHSAENPLRANEYSTDCLTGCVVVASTMAWDFLVSIAPSLGSPARGTTTTVVRADRRFDCVTEFFFFNPRTVARCAAFKLCVVCDISQSLVAFAAVALGFDVGARVGV